jgi:hypothetical protein
MGQYTTHQWDHFALHSPKVDRDLRSLYNFCMVHFEMPKKVFEYCSNKWIKRDQRTKCQRSRVQKTINVIQGIYAQRVSKLISGVGCVERSKGEQFNRPLPPTVLAAPSISEPQLRRRLGSRCPGSLSGSSRAARRGL